MDITLYCGEDHFSLLLLYLTAGLHGLLYDGKRRLRRLRTHQKLREEHGSGFKAFSHLVEGRDHIRIDEL